MPYFDFLWPVSAIEHIAEHGITPDEFEDVVLHAERRGESRSSRRPCCWGETRDGRYLCFTKCLAHSLGKRCVISTSHRS